MTPAINETHDAAVKSWVESANRADGDFPVQNLPLGVCRRRGSSESPRVGVAIGDFVLDIAGAHRAGLRWAGCQSLSHGPANPRR